MSQQQLQLIHEQIDNILLTLGWNRDELKQWYTEEQNHKVQCPFDDRHYVSREKLHEHEKRCRDKRLGILHKRPKLPSSARYFYTRAPLVVSFQENPSKTGTTQDTDKGTLAQPLQSIEDSDETLLQQQQPPSNERDTKRRPKAYRVRVTKYRSPIEVQRQLVQAYMQEFKS